MAEEGKVPAALLRKPEIEPGAALYLDAFWDLSGDRQIGAMGGAGRIPFLARDRWAQRQGLDDDAFEMLSHVLRALDDVYLKHLAEQAKRATKR